MYKLTLTNSAEEARLFKDCFVQNHKRAKKDWLRLLDALPVPPEFSYRRERGVVWVCDVVGSSKYLNSDVEAESLERFLPRLYWLGDLMARACGASFVKWTGDGFVAWFPIQLERELGDQAKATFIALWQLAKYIEVTQLGIKAPHAFALRHGVTYEPDALIARMRVKGGHTWSDIIGRNVTLAFRLSGVSADFPYVATQKKLVETFRGNSLGDLSFVRWKPTKLEVLKIFKGDKTGTHFLYKSSQLKFESLDEHGLERHAAAYLKRRDGESSNRLAFFTIAVLVQMKRGPKWARSVTAQFLRYVHEHLEKPAERRVANLLKRRNQRKGGSGPAQSPASSRSL